MSTIVDSHAAAPVAVCDQDRASLPMSIDAFVWRLHATPDPIAGNFYTVESFESRIGPGGRLVDTIPTKTVHVPRSNSGDDLTELLAALGAYGWVVGVEDVHRPGGIEAFGTCYMPACQCHRHVVETALPRRGERYSYIEIIAVPVGAHYYRESPEDDPGGVGGDPYVFDTQGRATDARLAARDVTAEEAHEAREAGLFEPGEIAVWAQLHSEHGGDVEFAEVHGRNGERYELRRQVGY